MGLFRKYVNQTRKPEGFLGKLMIGGMNGGHAKLADWGMRRARLRRRTERKCAFEMLAGRKACRGGLFGAFS